MHPVPLQNLTSPSDGPPFPPTSLPILFYRIYLALVMDPAHRGLIVQQGGAKALIPLANNGNFVGKAIAAQALCKIAITQDPNITFPGQRVGFLDFYYRC